MLVSFSSTVIAIFLFVASRPDMLPTNWQRITYYTFMFLWAGFTILLLLSLRHVFPATWDFHTKVDFMLTSGLFLRRMAFYNLALMVTSLSFIVIVFIISPVSTGISDKLFGTSALKSKVEAVELKRDSS